MLKPGGDVDSWCGKCKRTMAHTIEAMVGEKPTRVHCNTCKAQHSYKPYEPGEAPGQMRKRQTGGSLESQAGNPHARRYQTLLRGKNMALAKRYSPKDKYGPGDVVEHPSF